MMTTKGFANFSITCRGRLVEFDRPAVMGILNVTADSFYDGGRYLQPEAMVARAHELLAQGADIIDVGVASSRPGAALPTPEDEAHALTSVITTLRQELPQAILSADTCRALPAQAAIEAGVDIINDISGGQFEPLPSDGIPPIFNIVAQMQVPYILMHTRSLPYDMAQHNDYDNIIDDLTQYYSQRLDLLYRLGVKDVWLDPGFGFAKNPQQSLYLLNHIDELTSLFREPMLAALSRKSMIYKTLDITPEEALPGTIALDTVALLKGCRLLRVHDPLPARQTIELLWPHPQPLSLRRGE
jgi:dihydropteroate synthase